MNLLRVPKTLWLAVVATLVLMAHIAQAGPRPVLERPFTVVIDPGHGGTNDGCEAHDGSLHEKELTLELALELQAKLQRRLPHAKVLLTRDRDVTMTLAERVAYANEREADLLLSIHANASPERNQTGYETYVLDARASSLEAARTAARENDADFAVPGATDSVASMVRELGYAGDRTRAASFANELQRATGEYFPSRLDRGVRQAPFDVLMGARMPAVLHEVGFLDHAAEGALLRDENGRGDHVDAMSDAIVRYYTTVVVEQR